MNQLAQLGVVILGLYYAVGGIVEAGSSASEFFRYTQLSEEPSWFGTWLLYLFAASGIMLVTAVLPGFLLIALRQRIADHLFPNSHRDAPLSSSSAFVLGCSLLGVFFMVSGAAGFLGGAVQGFVVFFSEDEIMRPSLLGSGAQALVHGAASLLLGLLLYLYSSRLPAA